MGNYNDLLANIQNSANSKLEIEETRDRLRRLKRNITEVDINDQFENIHQAFYSVEQDIRGGLMKDRPLLKVEQGLRGANDFRYFTGHKFSLHYTLNAIEDNPVFAELKIELPYDLKSKAIMLDGIELEDKKLILKYDFQNEKFIWMDEDLQSEIRNEDIEQFIIQVLNIKLLNSQQEF